MNYQKLIESHPKMRLDIVWCHTCGKSQKVEPGDCLQCGWPKCCGYTMTIDPPEEWRKKDE